jgi:hypothetical protein
VRVAATDNLKLERTVERDDKDYAIEHAGYLATAAENYANVMCSRVTNADEISDAHRALRSAVYEFRKRADRVNATRPPVLFGTE